jgi:hypothetical protein
MRPNLPWHGLRRTEILAQPLIGMCGAPDSGMRVRSKARMPCVRVAVEALPSVALQAKLVPFGIGEHYPPRSLDLTTVIDH